MDKKDKINKCKDCKFYEKSSVSPRSGYCKCKESDNYYYPSHWIGCNTTICSQFKKK